MEGDQVSGLRAIRPGAPNPSDQTALNEECQRLLNGTGRKLGVLGQGIDGREALPVRIRVVG
jgi:hypothetical protein